MSRRFTIEERDTPTRTRPENRSRDGRRPSRVLVGMVLSQHRLDAGRLPQKHHRRTDRRSCTLARQAEGLRVAGPRPTRQERIVNEWDEYNGRLVAERAASARRQAAWRARQNGFDDDVTRDRAGNNGGVTRDSRVTNAAYDDDDDNENDVVKRDIKDHPGGPSRARARKPGKQKTATEIFQNIKKSIPR